MASYQRRQLKTEAIERTEKLRKYALRTHLHIALTVLCRELGDALWNHCNARVESNIREIDDTVAPYLEFVKAEMINVESGSAMIAERTAELQQLEVEVEELAK